jgi:polyribonucleotide nucleotidyltransferase
MLSAQLSCRKVLLLTRMALNRRKRFRVLELVGLDSEVLEEGQRVRVMIDKLDKQTGKISLSYRDLLENSWDLVQTEFLVGTVHRGTITRVAPFGCFVRLAGSKRSAVPGIN